jgi:magnesium-transporting ATPase (P-type)
LKLDDMSEGALLRGADKRSQIALRRLRSTAFRFRAVVGIVSLIVLALAIAALYVFHLEGGWRKSYVISAIFALYLNVFVLIAQMFQKIPLLKALAPTQSEPPFQVAQLVILIVFVVFAIRAVVKLPGKPLQAA